MKYFTKEWIRICWLSDFFSTLEVSEKAEAFSEEVFKQVYLEKVKDFLARYIKNDMERRELFKKNIDNQSDKLKKLLRKEVLDKIVDIRVAALGVVSPSVYDLIGSIYGKDIFKTARELMDKVVMQYRRHFYGDLKRDYPQFLKSNYFLPKYHMHDCRILGGEFDGSNYILRIDVKGGFAYNVSEVLFQNAELVKCEGSFTRAIWLYEEIYIENGRYELRILFMYYTDGTDYDFGEMIITADEILIFENNHKYLKRPERWIVPCAYKMASISNNNSTQKFAHGLPD